MDRDLRHRINVGRACVKEQISLFDKYFGNVQSEWKEDGSRVTFADFAISEKITGALANTFPGDDICSEESDPGEGTRELNARYCWSLDPIDGTNNFALGLPMCGISLGLLREGQPIYGFIYDYGRRSIVEGGPGLGLKDGDAVRPPMPQKKMEEKRFVGLPLPLRGEWQEKLSPVVNGMHVRSVGSGALTLVYTALGFLEGCIDFRSKSWDIAAAYAIMKAAEGKVQFMDKARFPLTSFSVKEPPCPFYAGTDDFCQRMEKMIGQSAS